MSNNPRPRRRANPSLQAVFYLIVLIWALFAVEQLFHLDFSRFGIIPREKQGLIGVIFAPFLHANLLHIAYNTVPLFVLSLILALIKPRAGIWVWLLLALTTDLLVWLLARGQAIHLGASGVIFALIGFLIVYGFFRRSWWSILLSIAIGALYGSFLWGVIPSKPWISWESHLFGLISGIVWGIIWGKIDRNRALKLRQTQAQQTDQGFNA